MSQISPISSCFQRPACPLPALPMSTRRTCVKVREKCVLGEDLPSFHRAVSQHQRVLPQIVHSPLTRATSFSRTSIDSAKMLHEFHAIHRLSQPSPWQLPPVPMSGLPTWGWPASLSSADTRMSSCGFWRRTGAIL